MIAASIAAFINASELASAFGLKAYVQTPDFVASQKKVPFALVSQMVESRQELWAIGDAQRKENPVFQVTFFMADFSGMRDIEPRFRRLIESATATDVGGLTHPGIDFVIPADLLRDSGDQMTYYSDQPGFFASPAPVVYKNEDANGEPIVVGSGFTVNLAAGSVTFTTPNAPTDKIRATYKAGVIDFNIAGVARNQFTDVESNPQRFAVYFDMETHYYIKTTANRYL